jgi:flagellar basal body-associated protein FliL
MLAKIRDLEQAANDAAKSWVPTWAKILIGVLVIVLICAGAFAGYMHLKHEHAVVMTQEQIKNADDLKKALDISKGQATRLAAELALAKNQEPEIRYLTRAPTVAAAAEQVKKDIDSGKSPATKIPADRTIVTPNEAQQKVDVYRITLDKPRFGVNALVLAGGTDLVEVGAGVSYKNKDWAANVGGTSRGRAYVMGVKYF